MGWPARGAGGQAARHASPRAPGVPLLDPGANDVKAQCESPIANLRPNAKAEHADPLRIRFAAMREQTEARAMERHKRNEPSAGRDGWGRTAGYFEELPKPLRIATPTGIHGVDDSTGGKGMQMKKAAGRKGRTRTAGLSR